MKYLWIALGIALAGIVGILLILFIPLQDPGGGSGGGGSAENTYTFLTKVITAPDAALDSNSLAEKESGKSLIHGIGGSSGDGAPDAVSQSRRIPNGTSVENDQEERMGEQNGGSEPDTTTIPVITPGDLIITPEEIITPEDFTVAFIGDSGYGSSFRSVLELIRDEGADMVVHLGDLGYGESTNQDTPGRWMRNIEEILDPVAPNGVFPYFFSMGNHDVPQWNQPGGYRELLQRRFLAQGIVPQGEPLGARTSFSYNGLFVVLAAPGEDADAAGSGHAAFIDEELSANRNLWDICAWHKNMRAMQIGGKGDETGWGVYEACQRQGAIIATAHTHNYGRTHLLENVREQIVADAASPYALLPGTTLVFHSGLGGKSVSEQRRCFDGCSGEWASIYTSNQDAAFGALFIIFHVDGDPRKARGYFKNIEGEVIDRFEVYNLASGGGMEDAEMEREETGAAGMGDNEEAEQFISVRGTQLFRGDENFRFLGVNVYGLANDQEIYACGPAADNGQYPERYLRELFPLLKEQGVNAVRFWAFQSFTDSGRDFSSLDRVVRHAREQGIYLIPVLENQWHHCGGGSGGLYKFSEWYASAYRQPYGEYELSYPEYAEMVVSRYKDEPAILLWQLMNEAQSRDIEGNSEPGSLLSWTEEMSALVKSIDGNHLVSLGTIGRGQAGTENEHFRQLHAIETIDVVEAHDYHREEEAWPSSNYHSIARAYQAAQELQKPFFIGEVGISLDERAADGNFYTAERRAELFDAKLDAALVQRDVAGYLIWEWDNPSELHGREECRRYCFTVGDPLVGVLRRYGGRSGAWGE